MKIALQKQNKTEKKEIKSNKAIQKLLDFFEMHGKNLILLTVFLIFILSSCTKDDYYVSPSSQVSSKTIQVNGIKKLDISNMFEVQVNFTETESVVLEANENLHPIIEIFQAGNTLKVKVKKNTRIHGKPVLNLYVSTPLLEQVSATGAVNVNFENELKTDVFELDLEGASSFSGSFNIDELHVRLVGASEINISGSSDVFDISAEGASEMTGFGFATDELYASLFGGCKISLTVNEKLDITAKGASNVYYRGNGTIERLNVSDASEIVKMD